MKEIGLGNIHLNWLAKIGNLYRCIFVQLTCLTSFGLMREINLVLCLHCVETCEN